MWFDELKHHSWAGLWFGYVRCGGACPGIRKIEEPCPACGGAPFDTAPKTVIINGREVLLHATFAGGEERYEDYIYLQMLQREWERPVVEFETFAHFKVDGRPSARAALVLLFWSYFETRIERLHRAAMGELPPRVLDDALRRNPNIGPRLNALYKVFYDSTYFADLAALGYAAVAELLADIQKRRNEFAHGSPRAINDATVGALVAALKDEHEGWIAVFNHRVKAARSADSTPP